jgi:asparagine synthase (glutamine-hydrolysing)
VLTYNGEIYNHRDIRTDLEAEDIRLKTSCDTEVLAELWERKQTSALDDLNGMFAFAMWDRQQKHLTLARDRLGERPLYYAQTSDGFLLFASELGALMASGLLQKDICPEAVNAYFCFGYVPEPLSIFKNVYKLPAAHYLQATQGNTSALTPAPYWAPVFAPDHTLTYEDAVSQLAQLLDDAVDRQMMSDVPLGAFLSGGVDSSAIVASMALQNDTPVNTCSIGFTESSHDERPYARQVASLYNTQHHEEVVALQAHSLIDTIAKTYAEPFADSSALPTYLVCQMARKHVTVALSGDGGDEVFAGYRRYPYFAREEKLKSLLPAAVRRPLFGSLGSAYPKLDWAPQALRFRTTFKALSETAAMGYLRSTSISLPERLEKLLGSQENLAGPAAHMSNLLGAANTDDPVLAAQYADLKSWLPGRMLVKTDRAAMAHSLEVRPPLLDYRLVEWAATLPTSFKLDGHNGKRVLKSSAEKRLPQELLYRKKQGFGLPVSAWLRATRNNPLDRLSASHHWKDQGMIDAGYVDEMMQLHRSGREDFAPELWSVIMFDAFLQQLT